MISDAGIHEIIIFLLSVCPPFFFFAGKVINTINVTHQLPYNLKFITTTLKGIKQKRDQNEEREANYEKLNNLDPFSLHISIRKSIVLCKWKKYDVTRTHKIP